MKSRGLEIKRNQIFIKNGESILIIGKQASYYIGYLSPNGLKSNVGLSQKKMN